MKRQLPGLAETARDSRPEIPDGVYLVRIDRAQFHWHAHKPFYILRLSIVEPETLVGLPVKISHTTINGISLMNFDGFAPASQWEELSATAVSNVSNTAKAS